MRFLEKFKNSSNLLLLLTFICLSVALYNPSIPITKNIYNYIFIVDISQSMNTKDMLIENKEVSRIDFTKSMISNLLERLVPNNCVGLEHSDALIHHQPLVS